MNIWNPSVCEISRSFFLKLSSRRGKEEQQKRNERRTEQQGESLDAWDAANWQPWKGFKPAVSKSKMRTPKNKLFSSSSKKLPGSKLYIYRRDHNIVQQTSPSIWLVKRSIVFPRLGSLKSAGLASLPQIPKASLQLSGVPGQIAILKQ